MYCSIDDVAVFCGYQTFTISTIPTKAQVEDIIKIITNEINYFINLRKVTIDKTNENTKSILRLHCIYGVCAVVLSTYLNNNQNAGSMLAGYETKYRDFINNIKRYFLIFKAAGMD